MLNQNALKQLASKNETSSNVLTAFALRERQRSETDLGRFKNQLMHQSNGIVDKDFFETFKTLENMGLGNIVYGRKRKPSKFKWKTSLLDVGKAAMGETVKTKAPAHKEVQFIPPQYVAAPKKKRGRPVGSKNKPKEIEISVVLKKAGNEVLMSFSSKDKLVEFIKELA